MIALQHIQAVFVFYSFRYWEPGGEVCSLDGVVL